MKRALVYLTILLMVSGLSGLAGCLDEDDEDDGPEPTPFDFDEPIPLTTYYHFPGAVDATDPEAYLANGTPVLEGDNRPLFSQGTYYSIGTTTFEPTIGTTLADNLYMTSWTGSGTLVIKCTGLIGSTDGNILNYSCENTGPQVVQNSNDPYIYVDLWTDRIMKFDMHAVSGMTVEFSDDEGASWSTPTAVTWPYGFQDHQTIASSMYPSAYPVNGYDTTYVFCVNAGHPAPLCSTSFDGGTTWTPETSGAPDGCNSGGLTGHIAGSANGNFYRGNPGCDGSGYSIYRSTDGGFEWTEQVLPTADTGTADTWNFEEVPVAADEEDNVHAMWMGLDDLPYYSVSSDEGETWSEPLMVAPPGVNGTGFPTIAAGSAGRVALGYIGTTDDGATWNGYMSLITDSFAERPLITTVVVNGPDDPLENAKSDCGYDRCGGFGDFIDMVVDQHGRPWLGLAHNVAGEIGIFGTLAQGPSLRGEMVALDPMPAGGSVTLA